MHPWNRNDGHRSCQCDHRNQPFRKVTILRGDIKRGNRFGIYKACVAIAIRFGFESTDLKFITAALFLLILVLGNGNGNRKVKVKADA